MNDTVNSAIKGLKEGIQRIKGALDTYYKKSAVRERLIIQAALVFLIALVVYQIYLPISDAFAAQAARRTALNKDLEMIPQALKRYGTLRNRHAAIEVAYREVEIKEGALSLLESLIRDKAGIASGSFTIKDRTPRAFGGNYEQTPFSVHFTTTDYPRLVDFMKELVHGPKPMILAGLDLKKRPAGDALDVDLEVTSIRRK